MWPELCATAKKLASDCPLLVGLGAAVAAALLAAGYLGSREASILRVTEPVAVVVSARDIAAGEQVDEASVRTVEVPRRFVQPGAFHAVAEAAGRIAALPIRAGAHLTPANARRPSEAHRLAALVPPGLRAVVVLLEEGGAEIVRPDDVVDVLATFDLGSEAAVRRTTLTVASGLRVIAVGGDVADALPPAPRPGSPSGIFGAALPAPSSRAGGLVALAATPAEAQLVAFAQASGRIDLALRPLATEEAGDRPPPTTIATVTGGHDELAPIKRSFREYRGRR